MSHVGVPSVQNEYFAFSSFVLVALFHHDTTAELGLSPQGHILPIGVRTGHCPPYSGLDAGGEGVRGGQSGLLGLETQGRVRLLADVETGLEKVSSRGHGGQRGAGGWAGLQGGLPGGVLGGSVKQGGGAEDVRRRRRGALPLRGQVQQWIGGRSGLSCGDLRMGLVLDLE